MKKQHIAIPDVLVEAAIGEQLFERLTTELGIRLDYNISYTELPVCKRWHDKGMEAEIWEFSERKKVARKPTRP